MELRWTPREELLRHSTPIHFHEVQHELCKIQVATSAPSVSTTCDSVQSYHPIVRTKTPESAEMANRPTSTSPRDF